MYERADWLIVVQWPISCCRLIFKNVLNKGLTGTALDKRVLELSWAVSVDFFEANNQLVKDYKAELLSR